MPSISDFVGHLSFLRPTSALLRLAFASIQRREIPEELARLSSVGSPFLLLLSVRGLINARRKIQFPNILRCKKLAASARGIFITEYFS
jgi:hypothetical protein